MNKEFALKLINEIILYYDARSKKHQTILLCLLNRITEIIQVTEGRKYFLRSPYVGQP